MTAEQFAYWLQGFAELNAQPPTAEQWQSIRDHLALVFNKVTPTYGPVVAPFVQPKWTQPFEETRADKTFLWDQSSAPRYCTGGGLPDHPVATS